MKDQFTTGHKLKVAWHSISRMYNSYTIPVGISVPMAYVLLLLSSKKGTLSTQIAPLLGMEVGSLSRLLRSMQDQKLIDRKADQKDKRQVSVYLTNEGLAKRKKARLIVKAFNDLVQKDIEPKEMMVFLSVSDKIVELAGDNHFEGST